MKIIFTTLLMTLLVNINLYSISLSENDTVIIGGKKYISYSIGLDLYNKLSTAEELIDKQEKQIVLLLKERTEVKSIIVGLNRQIERLLLDKKIWINNYKALENKKYSKPWIEGYIRVGTALVYNPIGLIPTGELGAKFRLKFITDDLSLIMAVGYPKSIFAVQFDFY